MAQQKQFQLTIYIDAILDSPETAAHGRRVSPQQSSRVLGLVRHGAVTHSIGLYLTLALQYGLSDKIRDNTGKNHNKEIVHELKLLKALLPKAATDPPHSIWTRPIGLVIPREINCDILGDASLEGMGGWSIGHINMMWRLITEDLKAFDFKIPKNGWDARCIASQLSEPANLNINILEFIVLVIDLWIGVKFLTSQTT